MKKSTELYRPGDDVYYIDSKAGKVLKGIVDEVSLNPPSVKIIKNTSEKWYHIGLVSHYPIEIIPNRNYKNISV